MDEPNNPTDAEISHALVGNEAEIVCAIEQISKQYGQYLAGVVYRQYGRILDEHDVREAVSRTLQALWEMAMKGKYKPEATIKSFLVTIVLRQAISILRRKRPAMEECPPDSISGETVWSELLEDEFIAAFNVFVATLPKQQKVVGKIIGQHLLQYRYPPELEDILAEMRGLDLAATMESVKSSLREIRIKLRKRNFYE
jgi:DNA-directed RNA polymerase specialized sigma24 family protein